MSDGYQVGAVKVSLKSNVAGMVSNGKLLTHSLRTFQWKDIDEDKRPAGPLAEYLAHSVTIRQEVMAWRWEGLDVGDEIKSIYAEPMILRFREQAQMQLRMGGALPDITDPETLKQLATLDYWTTRQLYNRAGDRLVEGVAHESVTVVDTDTGELMTYDRERPIKPGEERSLAAARASYRAEMQLLTGQATTIIGARDLDRSDEKKEQAARELAEWRKQQNEKLLECQILSSEEVLPPMPELMPRLSS